MLPPEAQEKLWFGHKPWKVLVGGGLLAVLLFAPLFTETETVEQKETVYEPVATEMPPPVAGEKTIKVYQGYMIDINGTQTPIDAVSGIVNKSKAIGPPAWGGTKTWVITLTDIDNIQTMYRDIVREDLTPTGTLRVLTDDAGTKLLTPSTKMVPREVTKEKELKYRVNFIQWIF
ncbi:MAG: hypothetical protein WCD72_01285 [Dehalococcoidia bacterium]